MRICSSSVNNWGFDFRCFSLFISFSGLIENTLIESLEFGEKTIPDLRASLRLTSSETSPNNTIPILYHNARVDKQYQRIFFCFLQDLQLDITHFAPHFIWLYQDSKEPRQYLSARESIMQINKTNPSSSASDATSTLWGIILNKESCWDPAD